jgi:glycosyltransferase involved in cell wall biosynthesis
MPNACRTHTLGIIKGFARQGCRVDALIPKPIKWVASVPNVRFIFLRPWQFSQIGSLWMRLMSGIVMIWLCLRNKYNFIYIRELEINPGPRWCARLFKVPLYIEINDLLVPYFEKKGAKTALVKEVERHQKNDLCSSTGLIINSLQMRRWLINHYHTEPKKFHHVLNGAEVPQECFLSKTAARKFLKLPIECFCLGFVGNIYERYDFNTLLKAFMLCCNKIPKLFLLFIGEGPSKNDLVQKINECGLKSSVLFTGYVKSESLGYYLPAMDVGLCLGNKEFSSLYGSISTKIATYGVYGVPAIVTATAFEGYPETLKKSLSVIPPEDVRALANLIQHLNLNRRELNEKAEMFREFAKKEMTWNASAAKILEKIKKNER